MKKKKKKNLVYQKEKKYETKKTLIIVASTKIVFHFSPSRKRFVAIKSNKFFQTIFLGHVQLKGSESEYGFMLQQLLKGSVSVVPNSA